MVTVAVPSFKHLAYPKSVISTTSGFDDNVNLKSAIDVFKAVEGENFLISNDKYFPATPFPSLAFLSSNEET